MLILRGLLGAALQLLILVLLLILPAGLIAGQWGWRRGWLFLAVYGAMLVASTVVMALAAPASLEARLKPPFSDRQPAGDKPATALVILAIALFMVFLPADVFRFRLLGPPPPAVALIGALVGALISLAGFALIIWTIAVNRFAIPVVEDQTARGQHVIDTGPYAWVRHPMYLGLLFLLAGTGLWLQSWASLPLIGLVAAALVPRILIEERTLVAALPGYDAYCERCRSRLMPFLW